MSENKPKSTEEQLVELKEWADEFTFSQVGLLSQSLIIQNLIKTSESRNKVLLNKIKRKLNFNRIISILNFAGISYIIYKLSTCGVLWLNAIAL